MSDVYSICNVKVIKERVGYFVVVGDTAKFGFQSVLFEGNEERQCSKFLSLHKIIGVVCYEDKTVVKKKKLVCRMQSHKMIIEKFSDDSFRLSGKHFNGDAWHMSVTNLYDANMMAFEMADNNDIGRCIVDAVNKKFGTY